MTTVTMELEDDVFAATRQDPRELSRQMRLVAAATWYRQGRLSQEVAAHLAGLDRVEFLLGLASMGEESFHVDLADLDKELARA